METQVHLHSLSVQIFVPVKTGSNDALHSGPRLDTPFVDSVFGS